MHQGDYIKRRMKDTKVTQEELAKFLRISRQHLIKILQKPVLENDTIGTIGKMLSYFKLSESDLPRVNAYEKAKFLLEENNINVNDILNIDEFQKPVMTDKEAAKLELELIVSLREIIKAKDKSIEILEKENDYLKSRLLEYESKTKSRTA